MSYVIARVIKVKSTAIGAMQYHNDRAPGEHLNPDIDPERTHLNYELHDAEGCYLPRKYAAEVDAKIAANRASCGADEPKAPKSGIYQFAQNMPFARTLLRRKSAQPFSLISIVLQFVLQIVRQHVIIRVATEVKSHAF